ncbi:MAG TPA: hypothetical protein VIW02_05095, partial [Gammaproteobacteria bacterium]
AGFCQATSAALEIRIRSARITGHRMPLLIAQGSHRASKKGFCALKECIEMFPRPDMRIRNA